MKWRMITTASCLCAIATCIPTYAQNNNPNEQQSNQRASQTQSDRQRQRMDAQRMIDRFDDDGDSALQRSELPQDMRSNFSQLDRDQNGELSRSELREHARRMQRSIVPVEVVCVWVSDVDQGRLSINDLQTAYDTLQDLDEDKDGQISRRELQQRRQEIASRRARQVVIAHHLFCKSSLSAPLLSVLSL